MHSKSSPLPTRCSDTKRATFSTGSFICLAAFLLTAVGCARTLFGESRVPGEQPTADVRPTAERSAQQHSGCRKDENVCVIFVDDCSVSSFRFRRVSSQMSRVNCAKIPTIFNGDSSRQCLIYLNTRVSFAVTCEMASTNVPKTAAFLFP